MLESRGLAVMLLGLALLAPAGSSLPLALTHSDATPPAIPATPQDPREALLLAAKLNGLDAEQVRHLAVDAVPQSPDTPRAHARLMTALAIDAAGWRPPLPQPLDAPLARLLDAAAHAVTLQQDGTAQMDQAAWQRLAAAYLESRAQEDRDILAAAWDATGGLPAGLDRTRLAAAAYTLLDAGLREADALRNAAQLLAGTPLHDELFAPAGDPECIEDPTGLVVICGLGDDTIGGDHILRIALGGNNEHHGNSAGSGIGVLWPSPYDLPAALLIDLDGDDTYHGTGQVHATGSTSAGVLLDLGGNDHFHASATGFAFVQGAGNLGGVGILHNALGSNTYSTPGPRDPLPWDSQGFGILGGIGILHDTGNGAHHIGGVMAQGIGDFQAVGMLLGTAGSDTYQAARWSQGFGDGAGTGILWDPAGDDSYHCTLMLCQAAAIGGTALLIDGSGDDSYHADTQAQGWADAGPAFAPIQVILDLIGQQLPGAAIFVDAGGQDTLSGSDGCNGCVWTGGSGGIGLSL